MELSNNFLQHSRSFESMLRLKGYTQRFVMGTPGGAQQVPEEYLSTLLKNYLQHAQRENITEDRFYLFTYAEYLSADNYKQCRFTVDFSSQAGFKVSGLTIESEFPKETQRLQLRNNQEIPGKNAIIGRFRKPKPWDHMVRGDFKFKKRR